MPLFALFFLSMLLLIGISMHIDRYFFKKNKSFCIQTILSSLPFQPQWESKQSGDPALLREIFSQPFIYLARGGQSSVFLSEDQQYVIKFYRFPSHLRPFGWLKHPFAYQLQEKRQEVKRHNLEKLSISFRSYLLAFEELREQSALLFLHLNPTDSLQLQATVIDTLGSRYLVDLDKVCFIVQKRVDELYPGLYRLIEKKDLAKAKEAINSIVDLILLRCSKGIMDHDAILSQNYGLLEGKAVLIDVGRLAQEEAIKEKAHQKAHLEKMCLGLKEWLKTESLELSLHLEKKIEDSLQ